MKVLVITRNAWDDSNAIGNTMSNFFSGIKDIEFANIYFRKALPQNKLCNTYFHLSEIEVLKKWFCPAKIGKAFIDPEKKDLKIRSQKREKMIIRFVQKKGLKFVYKISDFIWYTKKWQNERLSEFIETFSPDIVFTFVKSAPQYYLTIKYIREKYSIPIVSWIADDEYTGLLQTRTAYKIENLRYILEESSAVFGCSEEICEYYNSIFNCKAKPLYKGCKVAGPIKQEMNDPILIVYAGNLLYGRLEILRKVAEEIDRIDPEGKHIVFRIYSNTELESSSTEKLFGHYVCTTYCGKEDYEIIKKQLSLADFVLHVESFEPNQILKTRYSFSTKIIDGLQSGNVLVAIGSKDLASIKYVSRIPGACVINDIEYLGDELRNIFIDRDRYRERAEAIRTYAIQHHDISMNAENLKNTMKEIIEEKA